MLPGVETKTYSIRQLCREFGVTARALRFYEDKGLLSPSRRGQTRVFSARDRARIKLIVDGKRVGFSLSEIREMLDLYNHDNNAQQLSVSLKKFRAQIVTLKHKRDAVNSAIKALEASCNWIEKRLHEWRPDMLPQADDYHSVLSSRLDEEEDSKAPAPQRRRI
jgi:DNA-binding transcriptional MerR regulator